MEGIQSRIFALLSKLDEEVPYEKWKAGQKRPRSRWSNRSHPQEKSTDVGSTAKMLMRLAHYHKKKGSSPKDLQKIVTIAKRAHAKHKAQLRHPVREAADTFLDSCLGEGEKLDEVIGFIKKALAGAAAKRKEGDARESWRRHAARMTAQAPSRGSQVKADIAVGRARSDRVAGERRVAMKRFVR